MKRTNLDALSAKYRISDYKELHAKVIALIDSQKIKPVKASGKNGKSPALYREYWVIEEKQDMSKYIDELNYEIVPAISTDYYRAHIDQYIQDRQWVLLLNDYIRNNNFMTLMSENERSFDIWRREKFLKQEQGKKILKRCGQCGCGSRGADCIRGRSTAIVKAQRFFPGRAPARKRGGDHRELADRGDRAGEAGVLK